jgi:hypothetical protein
MSFEHTDELPPRPRRRLLEPIPVLLLSVLMLACGFIGGVLVEKGQGSGSSSGLPSGLSSRLAALRGGLASAAGAQPGGGSSSPASGLGGRAGAFRGPGLGARGLTAGEVSYVSGSTLYVVNSQGNTVKVLTSAGSSITKNVKTGVHEIHPGNTVVVQGTPAHNGAISAQTISVSSGSLAGGPDGLFGGSRSSTTLGGKAGGTEGGAPAGAPPLFGPG